MSNIPRGPIFLVGTGRCGSTIAYSCLAMHPDFGWIPSWVSAAPSIPRLSFINRIWNLPGMDRFRETKFFPKPVEPNEVFDRWLGNYYREATDVRTMQEAKHCLPRLFRNMLRAQGKDRFLVKMVGRPVKVDVLSEVFPDSFFIHVTRDLKPTVCSLLQVEFYDQSGLDPWPWGLIPQTYLDFYEAHSRTVEVSAAIKVILNRREVESQLTHLAGDRWMDLSYSAFVDNPIEQLRAIASRAGFSMDERFVNRVKARKLYGGADQKWKKYFTAEQIEVLDELEGMSLTAETT